MAVMEQERPPVINPRPLLEVDGQSSERVNELVLAFDLREQEGGLSALELRLSNVASFDGGGAGYAFEDETELRLGSTLVLYGGDGAAPQELFRGVITGLEAEFPEAAPPELLVLAEDALQGARMARRSEVYRELSLAELVTRLAQRLGLRAEVSGLDQIRATWVQFNESDLAFLRRLLARHGADIQVFDSTLAVAPRAEIQRNVLELGLFDELRAVRFVADLAHQVTEVTTAGWDAINGRPVSASARGPASGPGQGRSGAELLAQTLGTRREHLARPAVTDSDEARALAEAAFDQRARRFVRAEGSASGQPALRVGSHLRLRGVSPRFENTYYVTATHHRFDTSAGYRTDFVAETAHLGEAG